MRPRLADLAAGVVFAGILTCWAQGYWPVALVEIGAFLATGIWLAWVIGARQPVPAELVLFSVCALALWGGLQLVTARRRTGSKQEKPCSRGQPAHRSS